MASPPPCTPATLAPPARTSLGGLDFPGSVRLADQSDGGRSGSGARRREGWKQTVRFPVGEAPTWPCRPTLQILS